MQAARRDRRRARDPGTGGGGARSRAARRARLQPLDPDFRYTPAGPAFQCDGRQGFSGAGTPHCAAQPGVESWSGFLKVMCGVPVGGRHGHGHGGNRLQVGRFGPARSTTPTCPPRQSGRHDPQRLPAGSRHHRRRQTATPATTPRKATTRFAIAAACGADDDARAAALAGGDQGASKTDAAKGQGRAVQGRAGPLPALRRFAPPVPRNGGRQARLPDGPGTHRRSRPRQAGSRRLLQLIRASGHNGARHESRHSSDSAPWASTWPATCIARDSSPASGTARPPNPTAFAAETGCRAFATPAELAPACPRCRHLRFRGRRPARGRRCAAAHAASGARSSSTARPSPRTPRAKRHGALAEVGCGFLDCPVSGGVEGAKNATLAIMCGGDADAFERARPVLAGARQDDRAAWARRAAGQATKATNQILCAGAIQVAAEAMAFAQAEGLPLDRVIEILGQGAGSSWYFVHRAPFMARGEYPAGFRVRLHDKDLRICRDMAARHGAVLPVVETTLADYARLLARRATAKRTSRRSSGSRHRSSPGNGPMAERPGFLPARLLPRAERPRRDPDRRDWSRSSSRLPATASRRAFWTDLAQISLFLLWVALGTAAAWCAARGLLSRLDVLAGSAIALALALVVTALVTEGAWWLADYTDEALGVGPAPAGGRAAPAGAAAQSRGLRDRGRARAPLLLRRAPVAEQRRGRGAEPRARAPGADPPAFPVQQHEHDRLAHAQRTRALAEQAIGGPLGPLPRVAARASRAHPAGARDRDRARLRARRAPAARRAAQRRLADRRRCRWRRRCRR